VDTLLQTKFKPIPFKAISQEYAAAHQAFISERAQVESAARKLAASISISAEELNTGVQFLGDNITAALQFGNMEHLTNEVNWLKTLFDNHQKPLEKLSDFMKIYSQAIDKNIKKDATPIKAWLKTQDKHE